MTPVPSGRDTTAQTLTWAFYALSQNPEIEAKCRAEVAALGDELPSYENLGRLKYLNATFNETLRLYANVPTNQLTCTKDTVLAGSGTMVYAGELVQYSPHTMGYSTKLWGPDAEAFKPDRWFDEKGTLKKVSQYTWPVFKGGVGTNRNTRREVFLLTHRNSGSLACV